MTARLSDGTLVPPTVGTIAVRFHPYWAGSDHDGAVAGFYFAVVETLPLPPPGLPRIPDLPGPKAQDYHFTTKSDSVFIFRVSESAPDRQHAFFVYAVDNQGKGDPTPARVIFNAQDRFPPNPIMDYAAGTGPIFYLRPGGIVVRKDTTVFITESLTLGQGGNFSKPPRETVPLLARLDFQWHGEPVIAGTYVTGYRYKLDESQFVSVDSSVHSVTYNTGVNGDVIQKGRKLFTLRAVDQANGANEINRRFRLNYAPETWLSGPDSLQYPRKDWRGNPTNDGTGQRFVDVPSWANANFPGSLLSCDSLLKWPGEHPEMKTFFEIYDPDGPGGPLPNRVFVRSEGDTVHLNSWVLLQSGGSDLDSPYNVHVNAIDPQLPDSARCGGIPVSLRPGPPNGSPVAFRSKLVTFLDPVGPVTIVSFSNPYPVFDPISNFREPHMGSYNSMLQSGRAFAWTRAVDGTDDEDETVASGYDVVRCIELGGTCTEQRKVRNKVISFYVNKAPELTFRAGGFFPSPGVNDSALDRTFRLNLLADDLDPFNSPPPAPGGPSTNKVLRWSVVIKGRDANGDTATYVPPGGPTFFTPQIDVSLPARLVGSRDTVAVQLCDCASCEITAGEGRCVNYSIPFKVKPPPAFGLRAPAIWRGRPGPGPSSEGSRSSR